RSTARQHPHEPIERARTESFGSKVDVLDCHRGWGPLREAVQAVTQSIAKQPSEQIVRPGVHGQTGAIQPADGLVAGDQVAFVAKRVCGFLDLAIVGPRGLRASPGQPGEAFAELSLELAPFA